MKQQEINQHKTRPQNTSSLVFSTTTLDLYSRATRFNWYSSSKTFHYFIFSKHNIQITQHHFTIFLENNTSYFIFQHQYLDTPHHPTSISIKFHHTHTHTLQAFSTHLVQITHKFLRFAAVGRILEIM